MLNFIYGNPGTGKTTYIYSEIVKDAKNKKQAILIVPEQFTVAAEQEVIKLIPPSAQLSIEVLNFTRLANRLFRIYGGISYNFVSKAHEKLIMWRAIKSALPFLREYKILSADDFSLADSMLATYKELAATGINIEAMQEVAENCSNEILSSKISDITTICSIYGALLGEKFTDTNNELSKLAELLSNIKCLSNVNVYIDGFTSLTGLEHKIVKAIMQQAENVFITLGIPSQTYNGIDTLAIKDCSDKLRRDCASLGLKSQSIQLGANRRTTSCFLDTLSSQMWTMDRNCDDFSDIKFNNEIELYKAADIYDECEFAASKAKELIELGYHYKEIAIIARNIDKYRGIIEPALDNMGVKYFISEKTDLSVSPIAKFILSAIKIITHGWRRSDIIAHLKTGLSDISPREADVFECYTYKWNISGKTFLTDHPWNMNPDGYTTNKTERGSEILEISNKVREQLIGNLKKFTSNLKSSQNYKEYCMATMQYLEDMNVRATMLNLANEYLAAGQIREASDCARMYEVALDSLDCICDTFENETNPDINTFATALRIAFSESDLGSIPTSQDEITIGSANVLRTGNIKCAIILGACDGEFPANTENPGLFNNSDREFLINRGIPLEGKAETAASNELLYFRRAVTTPSEKLIVFSRSDSEPSIAFTRISNLFPQIKIKDTASLLLERFRSLKAVSEYAPLLIDTAEGIALNKILEEYHPSKSDAQKVMVSAQNDKIDSDVIQRLFGTNLSLTQSKTESFQNCKFAFACKYHLKLDDGKKAEFSFSNIGTFIHHILEKFLYRVYIQDNGNIPNDEEALVVVNDIIEKYINEMIPDAKSKTARLTHLIERLKATSLKIITELLREFSDSDFIPEFFELNIGNKETPSIKIPMNNGTTISISGIVDRVDVYRNNGRAYLRVVDYKTGSQTFSIDDIKEGLNIQLLLYIFSLTKGNIEKLTALFGGTPVPAGITYLSINSSKSRAASFNGAQIDSNASDDFKRTGLIINDEEIVKAVSKSANDKVLMKTQRKNSFIEPENFELLYNHICRILADIGEEMISGNIEAIPNKDTDACKYCRYSTICRASHNKNW